MAKKWLAADEIGRVCMSEVIVYTKAICPYCDRAKQLLNEKNIPFETIDVGQDAEQLKIMMERTQRRTVPQIIINDQPIGGFDDLWALERAGKLDELLAR
jgi:glutaredoxin 3